MTPPSGPNDHGRFPTREESLGRVLSAFGEGQMVEDPAVARLVELGWRHENLYTENPLALAPDPRTGRTSFRQAILPGPLRAAIERLNPDLDVNRRANGTPYRRAKGTPFHDGARLIGHAPLRCARRREGGARPEARAAQSIF